MTRLRHEGKDPDDGEDRWSLELVALEASILSSLPDQLENLLGNPQNNRKVIERLFPVSYDDPEEEALNRQMLGDSLLDSRKEALAAVRDELAKARTRTDGIELTLDRPSIDLWLRFLNDVRLVLATDLGVEENLGDEELDAEHPEAAKYALLEYLGGVEAILLEALSRAT